MIQYNGLTLAYIGDAVYELEVRKHLLTKKLTKVNDLHNNAIKYTNANSQAEIVKILIEEFYTEEELGVFKRGRNQNSSHKPKNADIGTYNSSTGFEAVIGYLFLKQKSQRLNEIINKAFEIVEELI